MKTKPGDYVVYPSLWKTAAFLVLPLLTCMVAFSSMLLNIYGRHKPEPSPGPVIAIGGLLLVGGTVLFIMRNLRWRRPAVIINAKGFYDGAIVGRGVGR